MGKGRIPERDVAAIRERTPIEEIVGEYVQLKPAGVDSLKGLSPFKDEKTPSFHVRPNHGYFHCFSTGEGGDVFSFLMKMEHITFPEAVEVCAEKIGYHISYEGGTPGRREEPGTRKRLVAANKAAHQFYMQQLESPEAAPAREFLTGRGFSADHAHQFGCGYAPSGWDTLTKHLIRKGFTVKDLIDAGLTSKGKRGPIDRFHRRLLWPIKNLSGDVIGFGARKLFDDDKLGKYMNTPETLLYHKSKVLFGLDLAKKQIAAGHQAVVVEGYTDVMAMHAAGVTTAVAACGTAFGDEHLQMLRRLMLDDASFRGEVIYTFDGDEAGQKAAMRAFAGEQKFTGMSYVAVAPNGMDPCDLRLARGDAAVRDLVARRVSMYDFVLKAMIRDYPIDSAEGRRQALQRAIPTVADIRDKNLREEYARQLAGWVGWQDTNMVVRQVEEAHRAPKPEDRGAKRRATRFDAPDSDLERARREGVFRLPSRKDPLLWPQREALKLALQYPEQAGAYFDSMGVEYYSAPAYRSVRQAIAEAGGVSAAAQGVDWIDAVADRMDELLGRSLVSELAVEQFDIDATAQSVEQYAEIALSRLQEQQVSNQIAELKSRLTRMRPSDDEAAYNSIFADLITLEPLRRQLLDKAFPKG